MRTAIIILAGLLLWAVYLGSTKFLTQSNPSSFKRATAIFIVVWLAAAGGNLWMGVHGAGYAFSDELPVFFVVFLIPTSVALFVKWRYF